LGVNKQTPSGAYRIVDPLTRSHGCWFTGALPSAISKLKHVYRYTRTEALGKEWQTVVGFGNKKGIKWLDGKWGRWVGGGV